MKFLFGIWTVTVALTVSAVAAYYSIIGLTAIFAAAVIPVIIMGAVLEVAKITAAIWLHSFWHQAPVLMKLYLVSATVILMLITSMGIFGFLSKAHIEQAANSVELIAQTEQLQAEIDRQEHSIELSNLALSEISNRAENNDVSIQNRIATQERLIDSISNRLDRDVRIQNEIIQQEQTVLIPLQNQLAQIETQQQRLSELSQGSDIRALQSFVGAGVDGRRGPDTNRRILEFEQQFNEQRVGLIDELNQLRQTDNPRVTAARTTISNIQQTAREEIAQAQAAINAFRTQLIETTSIDRTQEIALQEQRIITARSEIELLISEKFKLESSIRQLEAEVGPIKYIAELVYGQTNTRLLEQSVRWVIVLIVLVFDPLAIILVLAGISLLAKPRIDTVKPQHPDSPIISEPYNQTDDENKFSEQDEPDLVLPPDSSQKPIRTGSQITVSKI